MKTPNSTPTATPERNPEDRYRWRTYQFEADGVEPWAVVPLVKRVRELVAHHGAGELEYEWDTEVEVQIKFKARETTEQPKFGYPWGNQMDDDLMLGFGWRCLETQFDHGRVIDETKVAMQRVLADAQRENQYVVVPLNAGIVDGLNIARSIVDEWDRDRGALVRVDQDEYTDGTVAVVVTVDADVTPDQLADLAPRLAKLGKPRVVNPNRA